MSGKVYALQVGINEYDPSVGPLLGCLNDVENFGEYLHGRFGDRLHLETLTNGDATYDNIVATLRSHLGQAGKGDVALFQFSGHGARSKSAPEFKEFFSDGWDEGLVCVDSRLDGGVPYDLADKELAVLLAEIAENEPHLALIMDCCHSGSMTRGVDDFAHILYRQSHEIKDPRKFESYLGGHYAALADEGESLRLPASQHVVLAACDRKQKAWETKHRTGLFSTSLRQELNEANGNLSYADLFSRCRVTVRRQSQDQDPQFDSYGRFNALQGFLGGEGREASARSTVYFEPNDGGSWIMEFGAIHGAPSDPDRPLGVKLYDSDGQEVGGASGTRVRAQLTELTLDDETELIGVAKYEAEVIDLPVPPLLVYVTGEDAGVTTIEEAVDSSLGVQLTRDKKGTGYTLEAKGGDAPHYSFRRSESPFEIKGHTHQGFDEDSVKYMTDVLRHVAQWERLFALQNRHTTMDSDALRFWIEINPGKKGAYQDEDGEVTVAFKEDTGSNRNWASVGFQLWAQNQTDRELWLAPLYFSHRFGIHSLDYNDPIQPGAKVKLWDDELTLEDEVTRSEENFRLFVSTERVDKEALTQIDIPQAVRTKGIGSQELDPSGGDKPREEWFTKAIRVVSLGESDEVGTEDRSVADGHVVFKAHKSVSAKVTLCEAQSGARSAGGGIHRALEGAGMELLGLGTKSRGVGAGSYIELSDIKNADDLVDDPLEIELPDLGLEDDEHVLPITFDGQHFLVVGDCEQSEEGVTKVSVNQVPDSTEPGRRSLGKALKLYFFKTYLNRKDVDQLRWVEFLEDGSVERHEEG
ncbi:MAG: caspase family protein, partial [Longimicrobiales bacterium]